MATYQDVYSWRYYCDTESAWIDDYSSALPTECKNSSGHTLSTTKLPQKVVSISKINSIEQIDSSIPEIKGYARLFSLQIKDDGRSDYILPGDTLSTMTWTTPKYPVSLFGMASNSSRLQAPDLVNLWINKDNVVAVLASASSIGDDEFTITPSSTVAQLYTGMEIAFLPSGGSIERLGEIIDVDTTNDIIKLDTTAANAYSAGTTSVLLSIHVVKDVKLGHVDGSHRFGDFSPGSTILPAETEVTVTYQNNHPQDETVSVYLEMGYGSQNIGLI